MLTPEELERCADEVTAIVDDLESHILQRICYRLGRRADRGDSLMFTAYDKYQIDALQEAGELYEEIVKKISQMSGETEREIRDALSDAGIKAVEHDLAAIREGLGSVDAARDTFRSKWFLESIQTAYEATMGTFSNVARSVAYGGVECFTRACDRAYWRTISGATGYSASIREEIRALEKNGYSFVTNEETGRKERMSTAVERSVRTAVGQMASDLCLRKCSELGINLVLVSAHLGARPEHEVWQGQVFAIDGATEKYKDLREATGYGTGEGLCGWNCRHSMSPFIEGMHNPYDDKPFEKKESDERYKLEQKQRAMERKIRALKREIVATEGEYSAIKDPAVRSEISARLVNTKTKLMQAQRDYEAFCAEHDLRVMSERLIA